MKYNIVNNKVLVFLLTFVIIVLCGFLLSACDFDKDVEPQIQSIEATYKNDTFDFSSGRIELRYEDNVQFQSTDFIIRLIYDDSSTQEITSGFTFTIFKIVGTNEIATATFEIGEYKLHFEYADFTCDYFVTVTQSALSKNDIVCSLLDSYPYIPNAQITPDFTLIYDDTTLVQGVDYTITYGENNAVGDNSGYVCVNFIGIYQGEITYYFDITAIEAGDVSFDNVTTTYDGNYKWSLCEIDFSEVEGIENINYTFYDSLDNSVSPIDAGTYRVVAQIEVKNGYKAVENKEFTLTINPYDISDIDLSDYDMDNVEVPFKNQEYTTQDFESEVSQALLGVTFDLSMCVGSNIDNLNASTATKQGQFQLTATGNYKGSLIIPFTILPYNVQNLFVELKQYDYYTYDGNEKTISKAQAYFNEWVDLEQGEDKDYTISYSNNVNAGDATYTITGYGNYQGEYSDTFYISKAKIDFDSNDYQFVNTTSTYSGEDQFSTLLAFNNVLPEQVEAIFTTGNYVDMPYALPLDTLQNAGTYQVYVTFAIKSQYTNNYSMQGGNWTLNDTITINPVVVTSAIFDIANSAFDGGDGT
ncbi:MAG: hypothetical protein SO434_06710 [Eubacteriales bacterium]|nr:hypothetical protein [Eubacteriales bacterium]